MPEMNGIELCRRLRDGDHSGYIYVILLTSHDGTQKIVEGMTAGADDFISKPFDPPELLVRVRAGERVLSLETRDVAIFAMAKLAESRDPETGAHLERVRSYSRLWPGNSPTHPKFPAMIDDEIRPADLPDQPAARHRQGGHSRQRAAQAGPAERPTNSKS